MAINERLIDTEVAAANGGGGAGSGNQEEGLILYLDANDVDSFDGQGDATVWYDITNHEYKPATNVSEHFNTVTYSGASSSQSITGVGFQPDMVWIKSRNLANNHVLIDSVRGLNGGSTFENLYPNLTNAQANDNAVSSLDSDGFSLVNSQQNANHSSYTYVAWCFKAAGSAVSNTDGATTSQVSANQDLGFSIVEHTGTGSNTSIGHGLGIAPELIITKNTTDASNWSVSGSVGGLVYGTNKLQLNTTAAVTNDSNEVLSANGTTFTVGSSGATNGSGDSNIHYCFASKRGVSKVGSYTGNGSTTGPNVYLGFEPAFLMFKCGSQTGNWIIVDNKRAPNDPRTPHLRANTNGIDDTGANEYVDFNIDGFQPKGVSNYNNNASNQTYIYYAIAKDNNETELYDTDLELHLDAASFDGSTNTPSTWTDSSGNSNNCTITGATFDSELGNWLNFDGTNDYVVTPEIGDTTNFTYEIWINPTNANTAAKYIIGEQVGGQIYADNGVIKIYSNGFARTFSGSPTISNNVWTHLALSVSSGVATMYVNGINKGTSNDTNTRISAPIYIATPTTAIGNATYSIVGKIGQVRSYSSALTQDQIRQNLNFTKNDYPNGYNGTISGATWNSGGYFNFDGSNDYVDTSLLYKENNTVSMWVNFTSNSAIQLWGAGQNSTNWIYCAIVDDQDSAHNDYTVNLWIRGGSSAYNYQNWTNVTLNSYGNWNFLTFRMEQLAGANFYMSVNGGAEQQSATYLSAGTVTSTPNDGINIGRAYTNGTWSYGNSKISKFKVHDKPLTQAEITALNNEGE